MMDELKVLGSPYFKRIFEKKKEEPRITYHNRRIPIGRLPNGQPYYLDLKEALRISIIGAAGSGKSFLMRGMMDRLKKIKNDSVFLTDIKGELVSSIKPVQYKFQKLLLPGEKAQALPLVSLRPTFFKQISKSLPKNNVWYSVDMKRMTQREFMTFMNAKGMTPTQRTLVEIIYQEMLKRYKKDKNAKFSLDFIEQVIDSIEEIDVRSKNAMKLKFRPLKESDFFIERFERSIIKGIQKGLVPAINLTDFESFGRDSFNYPVTTLSIVLREIIRGRRDKQINPLWVFIDEATRFCGNNKDNAFKDEVLEAVDVERRFGTSFCLRHDTLIKTNRGNVKISDLDEENDEIVSWNFDKKKYEFAHFRKFHTGRKKLKKIYFCNDDCVFASLDHIFFVVDKDSVYERTVKDLQVKDKLVYHGDGDIEIRYIEDAEEDEAYDLSVPGLENFFLANGVLSHNCLVFQAMSDIPEKIFNQSRYVFVPGTENTNTIKDILNNTGMAPNVQRAPGMATRLKRQTRGHPYSWIVFDRKMQQMHVVNPLAPLSRHMEGGD